MGEVRAHSELLLQLTPICSLQGVPTVTYRFHDHGGPGASRDLLLRLKSFEQLAVQHQPLIDALLNAHARLLIQHVHMQRAHGLRREAITSLLAACRRSPCKTLGVLSWPLRARVKSALEPARLAEQARAMGATRDQSLLAATTDQTSED